MLKRSLVTQKQIAEHTGVSQTTVSLILSGKTPDKISDETRDKVLEAAQELAYVPQAAAKALIHGRSRNIGFVLIQPHRQVFTDPYVPNVLTGLTEVCRPAGYRIIVEHIHESDNIYRIRDMLIGREVDGIIVSGTNDDLSTFMDEELAIVSLSHYLGLDPKPSSVTIPEYDSVYQLVMHLISIGYQRIACISYSPLTIQATRHRFQAYQQALADAHLPYYPEYFREGHYEVQSAYEAMQSLLKMSPLPDALFCMNDNMALGAMRAIAEKGLRIPQDIAIAAYDDMHFSRFLTPSLTSMRAPEMEQGRIAGQTLIKLIEQETTKRPIEIVLPTQLMIRESCGYYLHQNTPFERGNDA